MKGSFVISLFLHAAILVFVLVSVRSRALLEVNDIAAFPVELVPVEELTHIQQGDKTAATKGKPSSQMTNKPANIADAKNIGNNKMDLESAPTPGKRPVEVDSSALPKSPDALLPEDIATRNQSKEQELASLPVKKEKDFAHDKEIQTPTEGVPLPNFRHDFVKRPLQEQPVEKSIPKKNLKDVDNSSLSRKEDKKKEIVKASSPKKSDFDADQIAALLNKQDSAGAAASRSRNPPVLGDKKRTGVSKLSQSEMDLLRGEISKNLNIIPGLEGLEKIQSRVSFRLNRDGSVIGEPEVEATGGVETSRQILASGARRAIMKSQPFHLPPDKYDDWSYVIVNFQP